jgi:hypothetical protein
MNPDVVAAIARLRTQNVLSVRQAALLDRVARGHLVSIRLEIRALLYVGVLLATSGIGLLVVEHHRAVGPWVVAGSIGLAAAACLAWTARTAPPFSWGAVQSPSVAFDYILLLGLLLLASDLAYVEAQFTVLGPRWAHHLLVVGAVYLLAAYRWDSRTVLSLALTTLAAWRGVSVSLISGALGAGDPGALRSNAIALGALYVALAALSVQRERKSHFEEVFGNAGLLLLLGALVSGVLGSPSVSGAWVVALLIVAGLVMGVSFHLGRSVYFALGVLAAYVGLLRPLFAPFRHTESGVPFLAAALLGLAALALIFAAHQRMIER